MTPIRSDKYQYMWKPRYNNYKDKELLDQLLQLQQQLELKKSELVRLALINLVKYHKTFPLPEDKK